LQPIRAETLRAAAIYDCGSYRRYLCIKYYDYHLKWTHNWDEPSALSENNLPFSISLLPSSPPHKILTNQRLDIYHYSTHHNQVVHFSILRLLPFLGSTQSILIPFPTNTRTMPRRQPTVDSRLPHTPIPISTFFFKSTGCRSRSRSTHACPKTVCTCARCGKR